MPQLFKIPEELKDYIEIEDCSNFNIDAYFVTNEMTQVLNDILTTKDKSHIIQHILKKSYPNTTLLYGDPGCGKTSFCKYLAFTLDMPFVYLNFAKIFDGVFGKTTGIISDIFKFILDKECVFALDEIDCVSQKRGTESDVTGGEIARVTVTLMQSLDMFRREEAKPILLGATNRVDIMDDALRSRFSIVRRLSALSNTDKSRFIMRIINDMNEKLEANNMPPLNYEKENIDFYCLRSGRISQRNMEMDIMRCVANWLDDTSKTFELNHIRAELF